MSPSAKAPLESTPEQQALTLTSVAPTLLFVFAVALVLYFRLFRFPSIPIDPAASDESIFLMGSVKIVEGKTIYKDFFQFITPGTEYIYALLIRLFGQTARLPVFMTLAIGASFGAVGLALSKMFFSGWKTYFPAVLFLSIGFVTNLDATHHAFSTLFVLAALVLGLKDIANGKTNGRHMLAVGVLCGLAFFFTQTRGLLAVAAFAASYLFLFRSWRFVCFLLLAFLVTSSALMIPVVSSAGLANTWDALVSFPAKHYRDVPWNDFRVYGTDLPVGGFGVVEPQPWSSPSQLVAVIKWVLIYFMSPGIYLLCSVRLFKQRTTLSLKEHRSLLLLTVLGTTLFLSVAYSPTFIRMGIVSLPAVILLFWFTGSEKALARLCTVGLAAFAILTFPAGVIHSQRISRSVVTPAGILSISDRRAPDLEDQYAWLVANTKPGDVVFAAGCLEFNYLFKLKDPVRIPVLSTYGYTTPQQVQGMVADLATSRASYIFWPVTFQPVTLNTDEVPQGQDHLEPLRIFLRDHYRMVHTFNNFDELWQRKDDISPSIK